MAWVMEGLALLEIRVIDLQRLHPVRTEKDDHVILGDVDVGLQIGGRCDENHGGIIFNSLFVQEIDQLLIDTILTARDQHIEVFVLQEKFMQTLGHAVLGRKNLGQRIGIVRITGKPVNGFCRDSDNLPVL